MSEKKNRVFDDNMYDATKLIKKFVFIDMHLN